MVPARIPLPALAVFALGAAMPLPAQQPAAAATQPAAMAQTHAQASAAATLRANAGPSTQGSRASASQASSAPTPQGNLIIQVMDDDGTPVPGANIEVDGMRTGAAPPGAEAGGIQPSGFQVSGAQIGDAEGSGAPPDGLPAGDAQTDCTVASSVQPAVAQPSVAQGAGAQPSQASPGNGQGGGDRPLPGGEQLNTVEPGTVETVGSHPRLTQSRSPQSRSIGSGSENSGSSEPLSSGPGSAQSGNAKAGKEASGEAQSEPDGSSPDTVQPGTAEAIRCRSAAPSQPALPPGVVALTTDAQGQLILQLNPGPHTLSVSVYGFDPFTGHFTLSGKHRQIVQIKLSMAPTTYVLAVGPDGRVQPVSPGLDAVIPLEPVQTLDSLPARTRHRLL